MLTEKLSTGGICTMKKFMYRIGSIVAKLALFMTAVNVNTACEFILHQPKLPAGAEKLSKINCK